MAGVGKNSEGSGGEKQDAVLIQFGVTEGQRPQMPMCLWRGGMLKNSDIQARIQVSYTRICICIKFFISKKGDSPRQSAVKVTSLGPVFF